MSAAPDPRAVAAQWLGYLGMGLTAEQHELRRFGVGSSEAAKAVGDLYSFKNVTIEGAWKKKRAAYLGEPIREKQSLRAFIGSVFEPAGGWLYNHHFKYGVNLRYPPQPKTFAHPLYPHVLSTPDFLADHAGMTLPVEIKFPSAEIVYEVGLWPQLRTFGEGVKIFRGWDGIPLFYRPQIVQHMAVGDYLAAHVVAVSSPRVAIYEVERNFDVEDMQLELEGRFWRHVIDGTPPPANWGVNTRQIYSHL